MTKNVLVTGGAGFLGSHFVEKGLEKGWSITVVDNYCTSTGDNIVPFLGKKNFRALEADISEGIPDSVVTGDELDLIANFASPASPPRYQALAMETIKAGTVGVMHLVELAKLHDATLFHTSTSEVYGDPDAHHHPQTESFWGNVNPYGERSCYDESKRVAEAILFAARHQSNGSDPINTNIVRIFNTYGPNMDPNDGRVVSNFIVQALKEEPITIMGDGNQTRSFCYVDDLIEGFMRVIDENIEGPINIGNPQEFTVKQLAHIILKLTGSRSTIQYIDMPKDDPKQRNPDISKATEDLKWSPKVTLEQGLLDTIKYFKNKINSK